MGLVILSALGLYLLISYGIVRWAIRYARRKGRSAWRWGGLAALVMYLIPFWDWIPTVMVHRYYCEKEAGFWVYKTLDQWKAENPGVIETLVSPKRMPLTRQGDMNNHTDTYSLNQRFHWVVKKSGPFPLHRWRREHVVVDTKTDEVQARYVDFSTGNGAIGGEADLPKFWLHSNYCPSGASNRGKLESIVSSVHKSSGGEK